MNHSRFIFERILIALTIFIVVSCVEKQHIHHQSGMLATGKGNGGNFALASDEALDQLVGGIKEPLSKTFRSLANLLQAETISPGTTSLHRYPRIKSALSQMIRPGLSAPGDIFEDIAFENNLQLSSEPCIDELGFQNLATTELLGFGKPICLNRELLKTQFTFDSEETFLINFIALLAHEFVHHYIDLNSFEKNEEIANLVQRFIIAELSKSTILEDSIVSTNPFIFVDQFYIGSEIVLHQVRENALLAPRDGGDQ